jgi:predicted enzyme related to lactoylglutathione lyase
MAYLPGKFVWFEHLSNDSAKARSFYEPLFGWHTEDLPFGSESYAMIRNGSAGIGGYRSALPGAPNCWLAYLSVADVDAAHADAVAAGAKSLTAPVDYGSVGRAAVIADPTGAVFALWKGQEGDPPDVDPMPAGGWLWNELMTPDARAALAFYERVFGYIDAAMPMPGGGEYHVLKQGDQPRAGLMQPMDRQTPPLWLPYVKVDDVDGCATQAERLGAKALHPPTDIPDIGRFAVLLDPCQVALAVMKPLPRGG